ncbi:MAG: Gldg family protein [Clostridia bacterium]|nr:Gldg family protein [Clostridia bacterium]
MKSGFLKSFADSRKMKYSSLSIALSAIIIALIVILNSITAVLSEKFGWYIDMTDEQIFSLTDDTKELLATLNKDVQLEIVFPQDKDVIDTNYANSATSGSIGYVHATAEQIAKESDNVTVSYHDVDKDYLFYKNAGVLGKAGDDSILILRKDENGNYIKGDFRVYPINYFYVGDTEGNLYGYNGELMFMSALLAMSNDTVPVVYFTIGHGEKSFKADISITYETINNEFAKGNIDASALELMRVFCDSGFTVKALDITTGEIPADTRVLVINQPQGDFDDDELYKINTYLENKGTVFMFTPHDIELPNLYTTLKASYGVTVNTDTTPIEDPSTQFSNTKYTLLANVSNIDNSFASAQYFGALNSFSSLRARLYKSATLDIDERYMTKDGYRTGSITKYTYPLLETSSDAVFKGEKKTHYLMSITSIEAWDYELQESTFSYLVVCPASEFATPQFISTTTASNKDMVLSLIQTTSSVQTPVNLDYKTFMNYNLDITDRQAQSATILLATILPAIVVLCGVVILVRRKHR